MADYKTMIIATDLSDPASAAIEEGGKLARRLGSRVVLTHVLENKLPMFLSKKEVAEIQARHGEHAAESLARCAEEDLEGVETETVVVDGEPHDAIVQLARDRGADLVVVGMHGHGFLRHSLVGSVAERVLRHAPCPVLIVGSEPGGGHDA